MPRQGNGNMARPRKKTTSSAAGRTVEAVRHKDKRKNIPTEELRDFVRGEEQQPRKVLCRTRPAGRTGSNRQTATGFIPHYRCERMVQFVKLILRWRIGESAWQRGRHGICSRRTQVQPPGLPGGAQDPGGTREVRPVPPLAATLASASPRHSAARPPCAPCGFLPCPSPLTHRKRRDLTARASRRGAIPFAQDMAKCVVMAVRETEQGGNGIAVA